MNIVYKPEEQSIEIVDKAKALHFLIKGAMILYFITSVVKIYEASYMGLGVIEYIWIAIGIISLSILYIFVFKKNSATKIPLEQIKHLTEKTLLGTKKFSILLKDGRERDLIRTNNQNELEELRRLFSEIGVLR